MSKIVRFEGKTYSVPDDATMDEIDELITGRKSSAIPADPTQRAAFRQQQDAAHTPKPAGQAAVDAGLSAAGNVVKGAVGAVPGSVRAAWNTLRMGLTGDAAGLTNAAVGTVKGVVQPYLTTARDVASAVAPDMVSEPTPEERTAAQEGLGANLALAAAPKVVPKAAKAGGSLLEQIRSRMPAAVDAPTLNKWMGVPAKAVLHGADPGARLLSEKLVGATKQATKANVKTALAKAGQKLDADLTAAGSQGVTIDAQTPVYDAAARANKAIGRPRESTFQANVEGIVDDIESKYSGLDKLSPKDAHRLQVELGEEIPWDTEAMFDPINQIKLEIWSDLGKALKQIPGVAESKARWGDLHVANKSLRMSMAKDVVGSGSGGSAPNRFRELRKKAVKYGIPTVVGGGIGAKLLNDRFGQ